LPAVRRLAEKAAVNLHTVRSAYQKLEEDGFVITQPGKRAVIQRYHASHLGKIAGVERSHTIGVILPDMGNPFYHEFIRGVDEAARRDQNMLFVCNTNDDPEEAFRYLAQLSARHVDGILVASHSLPSKNMEITQEEDEALPGLPLVTVDWPEAEGWVVLLDLENAGYQATRHLLDHNHQRIGLITFSKQAANIRPVDQGYEQALRQAGIGLDPALIARVDGFGMEFGAAGARRLLALEQPPTALFAIADTLALGAMKAAREGGLRIPQDLALTSFNNITFAELTDPPLTTVDAPARQMGGRAMEMLQELIAGRRPVERKVLLKTALVIRQSCGCV
jgi:LacI family transcriptional regulator, repressor for deo operon, udp, cdd, tsx, nupC, and nupG